MIKAISAALLASALFAATASAQNTAPAGRDASMHKEGQWRASKLVGVNVYNEANEKIGDINDVIVDKSGKVDLVVLGVGGFLGAGEHYVAVPMDRLKWADEPVRTSSEATANRPTVGVNNAGAATGEVNRFNHPERGNTNWYPDHAVLNATKDQLKAMPQFRY
jgi:sporulation protein YlmC with PRC-barrel domain